ncbi:MAG: DNA-3-methyladenine glycosylase I [Chitinophagales bacterium]|nr:DNA-3-methyladenine glycosylase I [Chitinophagales bacterium]MCZ2392884.1 DNA-3-methyladenine glycosylase I [Chitinophagales bacterium]
MEKERCPWCLGSEIYITYHDKEWGIPQYDDKVLFEFLILEGAQAGLSWLTILKRREGYRKAFSNFDYHQIALYTDSQIEVLMQNDGIIRNRLKIVSAINNARRFIEVQKEFNSFSNYLWRYVDNQPITNHYLSLSEVPSTTILSDTISKDLKKRGFTFVGSTIIYAYMQAVGLVNDHIKDCYKYEGFKEVKNC